LILSLSIANNTEKKKPMKKYPEFLEDYPVSMWQTALLYSKPPEPILAARRKMLKDPNTKSYMKHQASMMASKHTKKRKLRKSQDVIIHDDLSIIEEETIAKQSPVVKMFNVARSKFEQGEIDEFHMVLRQIISAVGRYPTSPPGEKDRLDFASLYEMIQKVELRLRPSELFMIEYIFKLVVGFCFLIGITVYISG
jgi:hypothetical protein